MKKILIIGSTIALLVILAGFLYLMALSGRYEINASRLVKIDKWTGEIWLYDSSKKEWVVSKKALKEEKKEWVPPEYEEAMRKEKEIKSLDKAPQFDPSKPYEIVPEEEALAEISSKSFFDPERPYTRYIFSEEDRLRLMNIPYWTMINNDPEFQKLSKLDKEKVRSNLAKEISDILGHYSTDYVLMLLKKSQEHLITNPQERIYFMNHQWEYEKWLYNKVLDSK